MNDKVLIIGGQGILGHCFVESAQQRYEVYSTYHVNKPPQEDARRCVRLDIGDRRATLDAIRSVSPAFVIHCAGLIDIDRCERDRELADHVNVQGTRNVVDGCRTVGAGLVFISSDCVFDGFKDSPYTETDAPNPLNYYGVTKVESERICLESGLSALVARSSLMYGPRFGAQKHNFASWVISSLQAGQPIRAVTDQFNTPALVRNSADLIIKAMAAGLTGIYNVAGPESLSRYEFVQRIVANWALDPNLVQPATASEIFKGAPRPLMASLDTSKLQRDIGVRPLSIAEGLTAMHKEANSPSP